MATKYPFHRNCTYILPGRSYPDATDKMFRERTHGCWCSSWKKTTDGKWKQWRNGKWATPKTGEVLYTTTKPPAE